MTYMNSFQLIVVGVERPSPGPGISIGLNMVLEEKNGCLLLVQRRLLISPLFPFSPHFRDFVIKAPSKAHCPTGPSASPSKAR